MKYWPYLLVSGVILIFAALAPFVISQLHTGIVFDSNSGPIGDTVGGLTAPFMSLIGSILVFAALKAQINANVIVQDQLASEKQERKEDIRIKLEILSLDIQSLISDLKFKSNYIKEYSEGTLKNPFRTTLLKRSDSKTHERILEFDRKELYQGFKTLVGKNNDWIKYYQNLYLALDYIPAMYNDLYSKYEKHVTENFKYKVDLREYVDDNTKMAFKNLETYGQPFAGHSPTTKVKERKDITQRYIESIINFRASSQDDETDLGDMESKVFGPFISDCSDFRRKGLKDNLLFELLDHVLEIKRRISILKKTEVEYATNVMFYYDQIITGTEDKESIVKRLENISEILLDTLKIAKDK